MAAAARIAAPSPAALQAAQHEQPGGASRLIQAYVRSLRQQFIATANAGQGSAAWLALGEEVAARHRRQWPQVIADWNDPGLADTLDRSGVAQIARMCDLLRASPRGAAADAAWTAALADLGRDSSSWELHAGPAYVAFWLHAAVDWLGLSHARAAGLAPQALRLPAPTATPPRPQTVPPASRASTPAPARSEPAAPQSIPARTRPLGAKSVADGSIGLDASRMTTSAFGTWLTLVALSWVALFWGGLISAPVGVGLGVLGTAFIGVFAVPLWATVWGLVGMNAARQSTLDSLGLKPMPDDHPLVPVNAEFARVLGIPVPTLCTVGIFNALAMGTNHTNATVALGVPLLERLDQREAAAVLGHELGHVVSGDMRRMMLMRTFQNAMVWFMLFQGMKQVARWIICWAAELYILSCSRHREYWADAIGASLAGKDAMIGALRKLEAAPALSGEENTHARFMVRGRPSGWFSTHPSFAERIAALENEDFIRRLPLRATGR